MATKVNPADVTLGPVLFEFIGQGAYVKVSAIDTWTNTEVAIVGDARAREHQLKQMALRKLRYVIAKRLSET